MFFLMFSTLARAEPPVTSVRTVRLVAVGDVLPHRRVKASAAAEGWDAVFSEVADRVRAADLAFANLESPVAPDAHQGIHGEVFNAPDALLGGLATAGFDVLSLANNHAWDQGVAGLSETLRRVRAAGMTPIGAGGTCAEAEDPVVLDANGVRVAWLAFTDLTNLDRNLGRGAPCLSVSGPRCQADCEARDALTFTHDADALAGRVRRARELADVVVVSAHWGFEYQTTSRTNELVLAKRLVDAGADLVLGHHPHVLQPIVRVQRQDGSAGLVAFSLGNFVSDMARTFGPDSEVRRGDTRDGGLLEVAIELWPSGTKVRATWFPTWTENGESIRVRALSAVEPALRDQRAARMREVLGREVPVTW